MSFVLLIPLAITSTTKMIKRLGGKWWQRLHRTVYVIGMGSVVHYLWLVQADVQSPLTYGGLLALLLGYRVGCLRTTSQTRAYTAAPSGHE